MTSPDYPYHRHLVIVTLTQAGSTELVRPAAFQPALLVLEGLDLVNSPVNEGSQANVELQVGGTAGEAGILFQAIVYATSQGSFSWRGDLPITSDVTVNAEVIVGEWSFHLWGHVEPAYGISP